MSIYLTIASITALLLALGGFYGVLVMFNAATPEGKRSGAHMAMGMFGGAVLAVISIIFTILNNWSDV